MMVLSIEVLSIFTAAVILTAFSQSYHARDGLAATDICLALRFGNFFMEHCQLPSNWFLHGRGGGQRCEPISSYATPSNSCSEHGHA
jgi:hypothetical protein